MKLDELKTLTENEDQWIPLWADAIDNAMWDAGDINWDEALNPDDQEDIKEYNKAARAIVEPEIDDDEARDAYFEFQDNDPDNWAGWINSTFDDHPGKWGELAKKVTEYGY